MKNPKNPVEEQISLLHAISFSLVVIMLKNKAQYQEYPIYG